MKKAFKYLRQAWAVSWGILSLPFAWMFMLCCFIGAGKDGLHYGADYIYDSVPR